MAVPAEEAPRRLLVTGAAGFVGSTLCEALTADGRHVIGVDALRPPQSERARNLDGLRDESRFALVACELGEVALPRLLRGVDAVVHLAACPGARGDGGDSVESMRTMLAAARDVGVPRVVWASSSAVYGDGARDGPCREETPAAPLSRYGRVKHECEQLAAAASARRLSVCGLRYFTFYGPRQRPDMALRRICAAACGHGHFPLLGDGRSARALTHVDDAVDALLAVVARLAGRPIPTVVSPAPPSEPRRTAADTSLARRELGWRPRVDLRAGIAGQLAWTALFTPRAPGDTAARDAPATRRRRTASG